MRYPASPLSIRGSATAFLIVGLLAARAFADPVLVHDYELNGSLTDALGGPSLVSNGGTLLGGGGYSFGPDQGLTLSNALSSTSYTIDMTLSLDTISGYRKLIDFKNLTSDDGLYDLNGMLDFYPWTQSPPNMIAANTTVDITLTRDGTTGDVTGFINGYQVMGFNDSTIGDALFTGPNDIMTFVEDDTHTGGSEASGGTLDDIRIYTGAATQAQLLSGLPTAGSSAVPDASATLSLLGMGAMALAAVRQRRQRRAA